MTHLKQVIRVAWPITALICIAIVAGHTGCATAPVTPHKTEDVTQNSFRHMVGITLDNPWNPVEIAAFLDKLPSHIAVRLVFDEGVAAKEYIPVVQLLKDKGVFMMGELLDSEAVKDCSQDCYEKRAKEYLAALPGVDVWEACNEINGGSDDNWLGNGAASKCISALSMFHLAGKKTTVTLYLQPDQAMFGWAQTNLPEAVRSQVDYALVSYYAKDNGDWKPDWQAIADRIGLLFQNASIGVGECGDDRDQSRASAEFKYFYQDLKVNHPRWIFGGFDWYQAHFVGKKAFLNAALIAAINKENGK